MGVGVGTGVELVGEEGGKEEGEGTEEDEQSQGVEDGVAGIAFAVETVKARIARMSPRCILNRMEGLFFFG